MCALGERPLKALEARRRGIPRNAGIDHLDIVPARLQRFFKLGRESLGFAKPEARRQAVAIGHQHNLLTGAGRKPDTGEKDYERQCVQDYARAKCWNVNLSAVHLGVPYPGQIHGVSV